MGKRILKKRWGSVAIWSRVVPLAGSIRTTKFLDVFQTTNNRCNIFPSRIFHNPKTQMQINTYPIHLKAAVHKKHHPQANKPMPHKHVTFTLSAIEYGLSSVCCCNYSRNSVVLLSSPCHKY